MDLGLRDRLVLVTAASQGLGFAMAKQYVNEGARVVFCSRDASRVEQAEIALKHAAPAASVKGYVCDVSSLTEIEAFMDTVERDHGTVEILVNNAGGPPSGTFDTVREEDWSHAFELTLMSVVRVTRRVLVGMRRNQFGRIVNVVSTSVKEPLPDIILSNTFRAGVVGLAKTLAIAHGVDGILINNVGPGRIDTDRIQFIDDRRMEREGISREAIAKDWAARIPVGRYGTPEEFAGLAVFLGSPANQYITGQTVMVDGGMVRSV